MNQLELDFDQPEIKDRGLREPHLLYKIVHTGDGFAEWKRLASKYSLNELFPKGTDLSRIPQWVHNFFGRY